MRGSGVAGFGLAALLAVVACGPEPRPPVTPPAEPAEAVSWPDLEWTEADLPEAPGVLVGEGIVAIAADESGFVAVGGREERGVMAGVIWFSEDGRQWRVVGAPALVEGVNLVDVAAGPGGFVAVGSASLNSDLTAILLRSDDGRRWERIALQGAAGLFVHSVAGGPGGYVVSADDGGQGVTWISGDSRAWTRVAPAAMADGNPGVFDPQSAGDGWIALRTNALAPAVLRSTDGIGWTTTSLETTTETLASELVAGSRGYLVQGIESCSPLPSCGPDPVTWWSGDATNWTRIPSNDALEGEAVLASAGDHGFIGVDGTSAWASTTGWSWTPLPPPGDGSARVRAVVARGDVIVAVGDRGLPDGRGVGWIVVAE